MIDKCPVIFLGLYYFRMMNRRRPRLKPVEEAKYFVREQTDKPGMVAAFINEYIGRCHSLSVSESD